MASKSITVHRMYQYRLYRCDKRDQFLHEQINIAGTIWNHALALQKRYYRLTGKYIDLGVMQNHIAFLRMHTARFAFWKKVGSQTAQDMLQRLDDAYLRFFNKLSKGALGHKKVRQRKSFTLKQAGWKLLDGNRVEIAGRVYKYVQHRPLPGVVKTLTVKRDAAGRLWLFFSVIEQVVIPEIALPCHTAGFDFGLKTFLTDHNGTAYPSGQFHMQAARKLKGVQRRKDKKPQGTNNRRKAARHLARTHMRVADKRSDAHYKLAHELCNTFDTLIFEDLNIAGMKKLWGRKVSDLAFGKFMRIVKHVAAKRGKRIIQIGRFERTTGKCSGCGYEQDMELRERTFICQNCSLTIGRDHNAAINIQLAGASATTSREVVSRIPHKMRRFA
jgi:putative transposase